MISKIMALLDNNGLIIKDGFNGDTIRSLSSSKIRNFFEEFAEITSYENVTQHKSIFSHSASLSLGGAPMPCARLECRLDKIFELIQFAAFYSDRVYINNFTYNHVLHERFSSKDKTRLQSILADDIVILNNLIPFIERGYIIPVTFANICPHCLAVKSTDKISVDEVKNVANHLQQRYVDEVSYHIEKNGSICGIIADGPEELFPHGHSVFTFSAKSPKVKEHPDIFNRVSPGKKIKLTKDEVIALGQYKRYVDEAVGSLAFELGSSHSLKTSYLSESELEIKLLQELTKDPVIIRRSNLMEKYLTCLVPFISDVNPMDLIRLRDGEGEHFIVFRQALNKAIDQYKLNSDVLTERDAQSIYSEIIEPHLAKLEIKMQSASRKFTKNTRRKLTSWVGAISTGLITGLFTSNFMAGTAAFGAVKAGADLLDDVMSTSDTEEVIRDDDMYFLWKVKKLSKKAK